MSYLDLRRKYPSFEYTNCFYQIKKNDLILTFEYNISKQYYFRHNVIFNIDKNGKDKIQAPEFDNLVFHLGLAEMFSYWKATCSPLIEISSGYLDKEQREWWEDLLTKGMGQYFYKNKIDFSSKDFIKLISSGERFNRKLVQVGGDET